MRLEHYLDKDLLTENIFQQTLKKISSKSVKVVHELLRKSWIQFAEIIKNNNMEREVLIDRKVFDSIVKEMEDKFGEKRPDTISTWPPA